MKQIYEQAEKTIIWLGHEQEETKYGFELLADWGKDTRAFGKDSAEQSHGSQEIAFYWYMQYGVADLECYTTNLLRFFE
jgi:hypothetical protein